MVNYGSNDQNGPWWYDGSVWSKMVQTGSKWFNGYWNIEKDLVVKIDWMYWKWVKWPNFGNKVKISVCIYFLSIRPR